VGYKKLICDLAARVTLVCSLLFLGLPLQAAVPVLELSESAPEVSLWPFMQYKFVAESQDSLVRQLVEVDGYQPFIGSPDLGYSQQALWLRLRVRNTTAQHQHWILNTRLSASPDITLYRPFVAGYEAVQIGSMFPYANREVATDILAFRLDIPADSEQVYYLRVHSNFSFHLPFILQSEAQYRQFIVSHIQAYSFFFGVLVAQALYNLMLFLKLRDRSYLFYVCFVLSAVLARALSLGLPAAWLPSFLQPWQLSFLYLSLNAVVLFGLLFAHQFLNFSLRPGWQRSFCKHATGWTLFLMALSVLTRGLGLSALVNISALVVNLMIVYFCLSAWRSYRPARFLLLGWSGMLVGGSTILMMNLGWLPMNELTTQAFPVGMMVDAMALSFALADRIRLLREENAAAQLQLTQQVVQARNRLEYRVAQRTRQLADARKEAERAIEVKNRYLQLISHDIRSPLTSLKMLQGLMEQSPGKHAELLQHSGPLLDQVVDIIDQLTHVRQIDGQQGWRLEREMLGLRKLVKERLKHHRQALQAKQLKVEVLIDKDVSVWAQPWLLGGVVDNLVGNAIKFSRCGQAIKILGPEAGSTLSVCDQGVGMSEQRKEQLFKGPVSSCSGTGGEAGQGFGLMLCQEIIEAHRGRLWCESVMGEGSCFRIWLCAEEKKDAFSYCRW